MIVKEGFVLRNVAGNNVVISATASFVFNGMIVLNETGVFMWKKLEKGISREALLQSVVNEYDVPPEVASRDMDAFINKLADAGVISSEG